MSKFATIYDCIPAAIEGLTALETEGQVTPMILSFDPGNGWKFFKFKALPGHPAPGNAGRGFTRPDASVTIYQRAEGIVPTLFIAGTDDHIYSNLRRVIVALGWNPAECEMQISRRPNGDVACADIVRGGVINFEDYPDVDAAAEIEIVDGAEVLHFGGDAERARVKSLRAQESRIPVVWTPSVMGRKGGKIGGASTSEAKRNAARENGKRGGRPRKTK